MPFRPQIAIINGGPSGPALCLLSKEHSTCSTIYEMRNKPSLEAVVNPSVMLDLTVLGLRCASCSRIPSPFRVAQLITVSLRNASVKHPHLVQLNGSGALSALGGGNGMMTHCGPQDFI